MQFYTTKALCIKGLLSYSAHERYSTIHRYRTVFMPEIAGKVSLFLIIREANVGMWMF